MRINRETQRIRSSLRRLASFSQPAPFHGGEPAISVTASVRRNGRHGWQIFVSVFAAVYRGRLWLGWGSGSDSPGKRTECRDAAAKSGHDVPAAGGAQSAAQAAAIPGQGSSRDAGSASATGGGAGEDTRAAGQGPVAYCGAGGAYTSRALPLEQAEPVGLRRDLLHTPDPGRVTDPGRPRARRV